MSGIKGGSEVAAQPVKASGANPFMPSVGKDIAGIQPPAGASSSSTAPVTFKADLPGLYGGTRDHTSCDAQKLVTFLDHNPAKAQAWASTLGIQQSQISDYVSVLTSVLLRTDARVTNHGYVNGTANPIQSVLEAGTAVFVDKYGQPVVKCYCGNPLTPPVLYSNPTYTGPLWSDFTTHITIINQSTTIINTFTLFDPNTGQTFQRKAGSAGGDSPYNQPSGTNTTPTGTTSTPSTGSAPEHPSATFSPNPVAIGDTVTLSVTGFAPGAALTIKVHRPDGGDDADRHTTAGGDGSASYSFPNAGAGEPAGAYTVTIIDDATQATAAAQVTTVATGGGSPSTPAAPSGTPTPPPGASSNPATTTNP